MLYVLALLVKEPTESDMPSVLLIRRCNATFGDGMYSLVGGKVESGESALQALRREVLEEVALDIPESHFTFVHAIHRKGTESEFVALCFLATISHMHPTNNEPAKHDDIRFFPLDALPINLVPAHEQIIHAVIDGNGYSEHGWKQ